MKLPFSFLFSAAFIALAACQTAPEPQPALVIPPPSKTPEADKPTPAPVTSNTMLSLLAEIDEAYAHDNCARVMEIVTTLGLGTSSRALGSMPATTATAISMCDSLLNPKDSGKAKQAAKILAEKSDGAPPIIDKAWMERMRADRLLAARQEDKALDAKRKEREILQGATSRLRALELDIYELSDATARLQPQERATLRQLMNQSQNDARLFETLRGLDEILSHTSDTQARAALITERSHVVARIEQLFAVEVAQLDEKRTAKRDAEARAQASEMKRRFPTRSYEMRIDAVMGDATVLPSATNTTEPPAVGPGALDTPVTEASILEKALGDARAAMNSGDPAGAVATLDAVPEKERNEKVRRLRKEAAEQHIKDLRTRVREVYNRAASQSNKPLKLEGLKQCKELLELILARYPETSSRPGVERNLKSINSEIEFLSKGP